jgi:hypothetical protein
VIRSSAPDEATKLGRNDESKPREAVECLNSMFKRTRKPFLRAKYAQQRECEAVSMMI